MRIVTALLSLSLPCALCAQEVGGFDYTYVDASLVNTEIEVGPADVDGDGIAINGSFGLTDNVNLVYGYSDQDYDFNIENGLAIVGSPDTVIKKLQEGQEKVGYDLFCTGFIGRLSPEEFDQTVELWGKEVIPAFQ